MTFFYRSNKDLIYPSPSPSKKNSYKINPIFLFYFLSPFYSSLPHPIFLLPLSSLASRLLPPHFALMPSCSRATLSALASFFATNPTKN